jgi:hypothetical protein
MKAVLLLYYCINLSNKFFASQTRRLFLDLKELSSHDDIGHMSRSSMMPATELVNEKYFVNVTLLLKSMRS